MAMPATATAPSPAPPPLPVPLPVPVMPVTSHVENTTDVISARRGRAANLWSVDEIVSQPPVNRRRQQRGQGAQTETGNSLTKVKPSHTHTQTHTHTHTHGHTGVYCVLVWVSMTRVLKRFSHRYKENWVEIKINAFFVARFCFFCCLLLFCFLAFFKLFCFGFMRVYERGGEKSNSFYRDSTRAGQE